MIPAVQCTPMSPGTRRGASVLVTVLLGLCLVLPVGTAVAASPTTEPRQPLVLLMRSHIVRAHPDGSARRVETVPSRTPLTRVRTVLPVLGQAKGRKRGSWLRVRLPGRPNGHTGWISTWRTKLSMTSWQISLDLSSRRLTVHRNGTVRRRFLAVVGRSSTPTPRGRFFIEEALALSAGASGGPFALATSARSNVFQEFEGGPGQIAIHGTNHLSGALGTAASHGCVRLGTRAINWMARRIGGGVPLTIRR